MKKLLVVILLIGGAALYFGLSHHFILFDEDLKILKKNSYTLHNTFVDARGVKAMKIFSQPDLIEAGIKDALGGSKGWTIPTKP